METSFNMQTSEDRMVFTNDSDSEYEYQVQKRYIPPFARYVPVHPEFTMTKRKKRIPIDNLTLLSSAQLNLEACYEILKDDVVVDTPFEVFQGVFKRNCYKGKIIFNKGMTNADISYLFKSDGFFKYLTEERNKWERLIACVKKEGGQIYSKKSLDSAYSYPRNTIVQVLDAAKKALKG